MNIMTPSNTTTNTTSNVKTKRHHNRIRNNSHIKLADIVSNSLHTLKSYLSKHNIENYNLLLSLGDDSRLKDDIQYRNMYMMYMDNDNDNDNNNNNQEYHHTNMNQVKRDFVSFEISNPPFYNYIHTLLNGSSNGNDNSNSNDKNEKKTVVLFLFDLDEQMNLTGKQSMFEILTLEEDMGLDSDPKPDSKLYFIEPFTDTEDKHILDDVLYFNISISLPLVKKKHPQLDFITSTGNKNVHHSIQGNKVVFQKQTDTFLPITKAFNFINSREFNFDLGYRSKYHFVELLQSYCLSVLQKNNHVIMLNRFTFHSNLFSNTISFPNSKTNKYLNHVSYFYPMIRALLQTENSDRFSMIWERPNSKTNNGDIIPYIPQRNRNLSFHKNKYLMYLKKQIYDKSYRNELIETIHSISTSPFFIETRNNHVNKIINKTRKRKHNSNNNNKHLLNLSRKMKALKLESNEVTVNTKPKNNYGNKKVKKPKSQNQKN